MDHKEQIGHFSDDVDALIDRYRAEYDMSYASAIGVFQMKIHLLCNEASEAGDEDEDET